MANWYDLFMYSSASPEKRAQIIMDQSKNTVSKESAKVLAQLDLDLDLSPGLIDSKKVNLNGFQDAGNHAEGLIQNPSVKNDWAVIEKLMKTDPRVTQFMVDAYTNDREYSETLDALAARMDTDPAFAHKLAETVKNDSTQIGKEWNGFRAARHDGTLNSYIEKFKGGTPSVKPSSSAPLAASSAQPSRAAVTPHRPSSAAQRSSTPAAAPAAGGGGSMPAPDTSTLTADQANARLDSVLADPKNELLLGYMNANPGLTDKIRAAIKEDPSRVLSMTDSVSLKGYLDIVNQKGTPDTFLDLFKHHGITGDKRSILDLAKTGMMDGMMGIKPLMTDLGGLPVIGDFFKGLPMVDSVMHLATQQGTGVNIQQLLSRDNQKLDNGAVIPASQNVGWNEYLLNTRVDLMRDPAYIRTAQSDLKAAGLTDGQIHRLEHEPSGTLMIAARRNDDGSFVTNKGKVSYDLVPTSPEERTQKMTTTAKTYNMDYIAHDPQKKPEPEMVMAGPSMKQPLGSV